MEKNRNIIEKSLFIKSRELNKKLPSINCVFFNIGASEKDLNLFLKKNPFVSKKYIQFLKSFSGATFRWLDILPIHSDAIPDIYKTLASLQEHWDHGKEGYLPFAEHGGGVIYAFDKKGQVWGFEIDLYGEKPEFIAESFEEFIDECLLGPRYSEFCDITNDEFYDFIKAQGWVKE